MSRFTCRVRISLSVELVLEGSLVVMKVSVLHSRTMKKLKVKFYKGIFDFFLNFSFRFFWIYWILFFFLKGRIVNEI